MRKERNQSLGLLGHGNGFCRIAVEKMLAHQIVPKALQAGDVQIDAGNFQSFLLPQIPNISADCMGCEGMQIGIGRQCRKKFGEGFPIGVCRAGGKPAFEQNIPDEIFCVFRKQCHSV